jgi:hypothetical protein
MFGAVVFRRVGRGDSNVVSNLDWASADLDSPPLTITSLLGYGGQEVTICYHTIHNQIPHETNQVSSLVDSDTEVKCAG